MIEVALRVAVLASGSGTILDAALHAGVPVELVLVDRPCPATEVADRHGVRWEIVERTSFGAAFDRDDYTRQVVEVLQKHEIDLVVMAGYGTIFGAPMFEAFPGNIINTHPALLPSFKGLDTHERAIAEGVKIHGATVHFVVPEMDSGPIVVQAAVSVLSKDTPQSLAARVIKAEHRIYPLALRWLAEGRITIVDGRCVVEGVESADGLLVSP